MSWSVTGSGTPAEVRGQLSEQFKYPLAEKPSGIDDDGERETVKLVSELCEQILSKCDPNNHVGVAALGHMVYADWENKTGCYMSVSLTVTPHP